MKSQWQTYQTLELISPNVPAPQPAQAGIGQWLSQVWRSLLQHYCEHLNHQQTITHLERSLSHEITDSEAKISLWEQLLVLFRQRLSVWQAPSQPRIWQSRDWRGETLWYVYDPQSGQTTIFCSEQEVRIWLETHSYHSYQ